MCECVSVGGESRRGRKGEGESSFELSYTHTPCFTPLSSLAERRGHEGGAGLPAQRQKDRQTVGRIERAKGRRRADETRREGRL